MHILIADDNPVGLALLKVQLLREGHEVTVAENGLESWRILQTTDTPRLAILDWLMAGMDGLEVCRRLRKLEHRPYVFVILLTSSLTPRLTSSDQRQDLLEALASGADDYLTKPLDLALLRARVEVGRRILTLQANFLAAQEKLNFQADHDSLTGLYSRAAILGQLEREISRARRHVSPLGVIIADLDHFKRVNDTHGHATGDQALCEVARRFTSSIRPYDTVGRLGGEEFLILLPGCDASSTMAQAERLRECICDRALVVSGLKLKMTASLGGASVDFSASEQGTALMARADAAMYQAKQAGRNRVEVSVSKSAA
jgi:two-component system cell cycle response regulator